MRFPYKLESGVAVQRLHWLRAHISLKGGSPPLTSSTACDWCNKKFTVCGCGGLRCNDNWTVNQEISGTDGGAGVTRPSLCREMAGYHGCLCLVEIKHCSTHRATAATPPPRVVHPSSPFGKPAVAGHLVAFLPDSLPVDHSHCH